MIKLSAIIPARNEFPNICHTVYSIIHSWISSGFDPKELEIIIVDNCSNDTSDIYCEDCAQKYIDDSTWSVDPDKPGTRGTVTYLMPRGMMRNRVLRILYDPIAGNHSARNKGVEIARGEYVFFSDAHMAYDNNFFKSILQTAEESGGLVHGTLQYLGAYPPTDRSSGYGYTMKLGEEIKGTWNNYKISDSWFYVPAQGHWGLVAKREQFLKFRGYPKIHRTYGGGEFYTDMKWWMFGSCVVVDPNAIGYHLASGRGYSYNHDDYKENVLGIAYALGMDDWRERAYLNWLRRGKKEVLDAIMARNEKEYAEDRDFVSKKRKMSFNQLLLKRPWESLNKKKHGYSQSNLLIYHNTWLDSIKDTPAEKVYPGKYQEELDKFINKNLKDFIYRSPHKRK